MDRGRRLPVQFQPLVLLDPHVSCPLYRDIIQTATRGGGDAAHGDSAAAAPAPPPPPPPEVEQLHQLQRELGRLAASVNEHARILDGELASLDALLSENIPPGAYDAGFSATASPTSDAGFQDYFDYVPDGGDGQGMPVPATVVATKAWSRLSIGSTGSAERGSGRVRHTTPYAQAPPRVGGRSSADGTRRPRAGRGNTADPGRSASQMREYINQIKPKKRADGGENDGPPSGEDRRRRLASEDEFDLQFQAPPSKHARYEDGQAAGGADRHHRRDDRDHRRNKKGGGKHPGSKSVGRIGSSGAPLGSEPSANSAGMPAAAVAAGPAPVSVPGDVAGDGGDDPELTGRARIGSVQFETFLKFIEPYFRPLTESDLTLLDVGDDVDPYVYMIPPLGPHYSGLWMEQDRIAGVSHDDGVKVYTTPVTEGDTLPQLCGFLTERVTAALLEEQLVATMTHFTASEESDDSAAALAIQAASDRPLSRIDFNALEARLKRELIFIGLLEDPSKPDPERSTREDDEVCFQLRHLQNQLRIQVSLNSARRARIHSRAFAFLAYQEYEQLMEDVRKQIEAVYSRRHASEAAQIKASKKTKRALRLKPMAEPDRRLLERADKLVRRLASVFPPERFRSPAASIFEGWEQGANPNPSALLDGSVYPSKSVPHPVLQSLLTGLAPYGHVAPSPSGTGPMPGGITVPHTGSPAIGSPAGGWAGSGSLADLYGSGSAPAAQQRSSHGHGKFAPSGADGAPPPSKKKKAGGGSSSRSKSSAKGLPFAAYTSHAPP